MNIEDIRNLSLGDWCSWENHSIRITELMYGGVKGEFNHQELSDWLTIDDVEPIPLTLEILEKSGFAIKKKWAQKGNFGDNPLIMWHYDDDIITRDFKHELEIHQNDTGKVHVRIQCDYVHELQHALRLCGLNNLADNLKLEE